ncbi:putative aminoacyltransferase, E1 ubiquitin-activating enzyme [Lupinus albus]|uniref:Putative aminoacyltransferase, E1 ubiquitin-activating enzyme n=1 Tax=Lupinus albus TaxID=3870 RepID=A0A6A4NKL6_LUPAL|nr:putative aminoacyltransferase, E1 ubiquitin-activating enzyme [Lupinus albus]
MFLTITFIFALLVSLRIFNIILQLNNVPLEGFSGLQGISGSQKFQIHKSYGSADHLPSAHTWYLFSHRFNLVIFF